MALTEMVWGTVFTSYNLYNNVYPGLRPWTNWADVHSNFSRVDLYVTVGIPPAFLRTLMLFWWTMPASSIIFFVFFGFGEEAKKEYNKLWTAFKEKVLRKPAEKKGIQFMDSFPRRFVLLGLFPDPFLPVSFLAVIVVVVLCTSLSSRAVHLPCRPTRSFPTPP